MDIETLLHVENDLRKQNSAVDKHITSLHGRTGKLRSKQHELEKKYKKVRAAKDWEVKQRDSQTKELDQAKAELETKRLQRRLLTEQGAKLRKDIHELDSKLKFLHQEERTLEEKYSHPSLAEVVMNEAGRIGPVSQQLANKTVQKIFPELRIGFKEAGLVQRRLAGFSGITSFFTALCVYVLGLSLLFLTYRFVRNIQRMLTLSRVLFTIDMTFVVMWGLIILCFGTIFQDPLQVMALNHVTLAVVVQILIMASLIGNVFMRCVLVSTKLRTLPSVELFWTVFVAQHYYQAVWVPFLLDKDMKSSAASYSGYFVVHCTLGIYRARSLGRAQGLGRKSCRFEEGQIQNQGDWLKSELERTIQYCEDFLTTGPAGSETDVQGPFR